MDVALVPLSGGHRNRAFRTVGLRNELVFKSTRRPKDAIEWLVPVHELAESCDFVIPKLIRNKHGMLVEDGWTCEIFIAGEPFDIADLPSIVCDVSHFHQRAAAIAQRPGFLASQDLLNFDVGGDVDLTSMPDDVTERCREAWRRLSPGLCTVVHGDLNPSNLIRCSDGRVGIVDWDECRRDLSLFDIGQLKPLGPDEQKAIAAWEIACSWQLEPDYARQLITQL